MPMPSDPATHQRRTIMAMAPQSMKKNAATAPMWKGVMAMAVIQFDLPSSPFVHKFRLQESCRKRQYQEYRQIPSVILLSAR